MITLDAVNIMLDGIGEDRVNSLDTGYTESTLAKKVLENTSRSVQAKGWYFNRDINLTLHVDIDGYIPLPLNILSLSIDNRYVQRGVRVYDRIKHTFKIDKELKANTIVELDFSELPSIAQSYITTLAAMRFQEQVLGSVSVDSFQREASRTAYVDLLEDESLNSHYNILNNKELQNMMYRGV